jgi:hypothetical protein
MGKVEGWRTPSTKPIDPPIDLAARDDTFIHPERVPYLGSAAQFTYLHNLRFGTGRASRCVAMPGN